MTRLLLFLIGFLTTLFGVAAGAMLRGHFPANQSDWVNFTGALLGAVVTVTGAVVVLEWQSAREKSQHRDLLRELLNEILDTIARVRMPRGDERFSEAAMQESAIDTLVHKISVLQNTRQWIVPDSAAMVRSFGYIGELKADPDWKEGLAAHRLYGGHADLSRELEPVSAMARAALRELKR